MSFLLFPHMSLTKHREHASFCCDIQLFSGRCTVLSEREQHYLHKREAWKWKSLLRPE